MVPSYYVLLPPYHPHLLGIGRHEFVGLGLGVDAGFGSFDGEGEGIGDDEGGALNLTLLIRRVGISISIGLE